jgi:putative ABC transport system substrate-binding protein
MRRRAFIAGLGGAAAAAWPLAARAQQAPTPVPVVGLIGGVAPENYQRFVAALLQGLKEAGFVDGDNVRVEQRWARGQLDQLPSLAGELMARRVAVILTAGGTSVALAVKRTGTTIPVVFALGSDPVEDGLVASLNRPGGTITGVTFFTNALLAKRLELLRDIIPNTALIAALVNPKNARAGRDTADLQAAANGIGQAIEFYQASTADELDASFEKLARAKAGAVLVTSDAFFASRREQLVVLAARHGIAATFGTREFVVAGGLASYGANVADSHRQAGIYAGRILKGEKPADLPVMQPTKFELVLNLRTAKALGLTIPSKLLFTADEVIE